LERELAENRIAILWLSVALFNQLAQEKPELFRPLRYLIVGGEVLSTKHINLVRSRCPGVRILNVYGPTENTTFSTFYPIERDFDSDIPIGKPISNTTAYVVGKRGELLPKGIYGELVLGGDGVARGYLNLPEQTAEKFVPSPFAAGERLYRSGDIVRWLPDGSLEYLGRADTQVKIRGFRVELEEIRRKLTAHPSIKEAFVAARENEQRGKYLCAYVTVEGTLDKSAVRAYLKESLPEYMVPSYLKPLDSLPLTTNGKVDVRALPEISPDELAEGAYEAPGTPTEAKLAEIWQDVLGVSSVGIHDHFFDLGGHSLKAMILVSRIHQALDVEISVRQVFLTPTVASLADALEAAAEGGTYEALKRAEEREYYPLSSAQKRLYVLQQLEGAELSYNMPVALRLSGALDRERLEAALGALIARHEALRTSFTLVNGEPVQRVQSAAAYAISYEEANERVAAERIQAFLHPFDLSEAPLLRTSLVRLGEAEHLLLFDMHHIVSDGTSMGIFVHELTRLYAGEQLEPLRLQYRDYAVWQQAFKQSPAYGKQEAYWLERFAGELPVLNLPADHPRPAVRSFDGARLEFELDAALSAEVRELARASGATLYMVLLAAFSALLARLSGQEELIVGSPVAGRPHAELQGLLGMFVSTLAIRSAPAREKTFKQYVEEVKEITMSAYEHADYPFEELVEQVVQQRDISRNPIFDVMFALQNMEQFELSMAEVEVSSYELDNPVSKFDLSLFVSEQGDRLHCTLEYATALFEPGTIARWRDNFIVLLQHVVSDPEISLGKANLLGSQDLLCLQAWTNGPALQVPDLTLHELFQEQADRTPDRTALVFGEERLTYRELDRLSDRMALALQHDRIGTGSIVGLMAGRSPLMVISLLGILKAGAAFLAVDPSYPAERIAYMLEDSRVSCLLVDAAQTIGHLAYQGQVRIMEEMMSESGRSGAARRQVQNDSGQLAYIIYTSGTTGSPKGIMMKHSNLINLIMHQYEHTSIPFDKNVLQYSSYSFDVSYQEIFSTLLAGGTVYLIEEEMRQDPVALFRFVEERDIRAMLLPASFVKFVWNDPTYESVWPKSVQHLVAAGEALVVGPALRRYMREQGVTLHNHYGPSEAHVTTMYIMPPQGTILEQPPVGRPISNASIYIVDPFGQPQPVGVAGEVYVGGAGVGRGYLHKPELTREKFVPNPWSPGTLMYRTGDMARWLADGNIEYLGRIDHQVKIRGYRIEPGEIEARLLGIEGIREAVVLVIPDDQGNNELCAYFAGDREFVLLELREALKTMLPDYMIPAYFVQLEELPVTSQSGKIDRKALPKPEGGIRTGAPYSAPRNETEAKLAGLWREVLGLENIGVHDNFFHMGGHSLKATVLTGKLHKQFNVEVPLKEIFRNPTIRELSAVIESGRENRYETIEPCGEQAYYATSSAQKRMYLVQQLEQGIAYNMPILCEIDGEADPDRIEAAFRALVRRHESLRTSFEDRDGEIVQVIHSGASFRLERSAQNGQKLESLIRRFVRPFDLGQAPLFRAELVKSGNAAYLFVDMHHIVSDGVSLDIVLNDFTELYNGKEPEPLRLQYKDYAAWQNKLVQSEEMKRQEAYWTERFAGEIPVLHLPYDYGRPAAQSFEGDLGHFALDERLTEGIRGIARETGSTTHMVMLSLFHILLAKYSGQDDIVIGSPIAGRPHADLQNIVGMFVNTLALRNQAAGEKSYREFLKEVRDHALEAYENQSYPFETLLDNIQVQRDPGRNPLFDVMFNMSHLKEGTDGKLAGLRLKPIPREHRISKFDLTLHVMENEQAFACSFEYCTRLFHAGTIARMGLHYRQIAAQVCADREVRLADIDLITEEEKREILEEINATKRDYPRDRTIHALFEEQAEKGPDRIAAVYGSRTITYRELNARANQLAAALRGKGVRPDTV
ncbi:non-ribosomal peptide synthetase, partial [Paenibacillus ehimensis]|uniref:non-ribosomal peptide synthetase n=1 Tax=Paenibacillus ehimensis TaxID=79264 RepID=UPI00046F0D6D